MSNSSDRSAVFGLGNTLRKDDGIGILLLENVKNSLAKPNIEYFNFGTASFDLLNKMKNYEKVLLIDAIDASLEPGDLKIFKLADAKTEIKTAHLSTHELDLTTLFEMVKKLNIKTKIFIAGVQQEDVSYGEGISGSLFDKFQVNTAKIIDFLKKTAF